MTEKQSRLPDKLVGDWLRNEIDSRKSRALLKCNLLMFGLCTHVVKLFCTTLHVFEQSIMKVIFLVSCTNTPTVGLIHVNTFLVYFDTLLLFP